MRHNNTLFSQHPLCATLQALFKNSNICTCLVMCHILHFSFKSIPFKCDILTQHTVCLSLTPPPQHLSLYYLTSIEFANKSVIPFSVEFILTICMMTNGTGNDNDVSKHSFGFCFRF